MGLTLALAGLVLALAILGLAMMALIWTLLRAARPTLNNESPLDILQRRYARGELSAEQFETMKRQLIES